MMRVFSSRRVSITIDLRARAARFEQRYARPPSASWRSWSSRLSVPFGGPGLEEPRPRRHQESGGMATDTQEAPDAGAYEGRTDDDGGELAVAACRAQPNAEVVAGDVQAYGNAA
jgi:hypothetical protein